MKIIGVGNPDRGDDGVGILVAEKLQERGLSEVEIELQNGDGASLMESWKGESHVIVIDCAQSGSSAGTIHHIRPNQDSLKFHHFVPTTHHFGLAEAVELCRVFNELPRDFEIYAIEGSDFTSGASLCTEVEKAAEQVVTLICTSAKK